MKIDEDNFSEYCRSRYGSHLPPVEKISDPSYYKSIDEMKDVLDQHLYFILKEIETSELLRVVEDTLFNKGLENEYKNLFYSLRFRNNLVLVPMRTFVKIVDIIDNNNVMAQLDFESLKDTGVLIKKYCFHVI